MADLAGERGVPTPSYQSVRRIVRDISPDLWTLAHGTWVSVDNLYGSGTLFVTLAGAGAHKPAASRQLSCACLLGRLLLDVVVLWDLWLLKVLVRFCFHICRR